MCTSLSVRHRLFHRSLCATQLGRGPERLVPYPHAMVQLVPQLQPSQDAHGVLGAGLTDVHLLEPARQGFLRLDVLPVLVDGRGANTAELAAGEGKLEEGLCHWRWPSCLRETEGTEEEKEEESHCECP